MTASRSVLSGRVFPTLALVFVLLASAAALPIVAGDPPNPDGPKDPQAVLERVMGRMTTELNLTKEQQSKVEPIMRDQVTGLAELREARGSGDSDARAKAREEIKQLQKQTSERLSAVLSPDQMTRYHEMQEEMHKNGPRPTKKKPA